MSETNIGSTWKCLYLPQMIHFGFVFGFSLNVLFKSVGLLCFIKGKVQHFGKYAYLICLFFCPPTTKQMRRLRGQYEATASSAQLSGKNTGERRAEVCPDASKSASDKHKLTWYINFLKDICTNQEPNQQFLQESNFSGLLQTSWRALEVPVGRLC